MRRPDNRITAEGAVTGSDVTVYDNLQASRSTERNISEVNKSLVSKQPTKGPCNERAATRAEVLKEDTMSRTKTQVGHLRLAAEEEPGPSIPFISEENPQHNKNHIVANSRRPCDITLAINIKVSRFKTSVHAFSMTVPASKCSRWNELRGEVIAASWQNARVNTLNKVIFRLEEDGKAASMTLAPTRIDAQTAFPGKIYEGWYHRILRGKQSSYKVDVKIDF